MFNLDFLAKCHANVFNYLNRLFEIQNHCVCFLISHKHQYIWKDWFTGKRYVILLSDAMNHREMQEINKIRKSSFKVVV